MKQLMSMESLQKQTNSNIQDKANLIWECATHLVGLFKSHEYGKVILPMTVLKRFEIVYNIMCFHPDPENWVQCAYIKIGFFADNDADILYQDEIHGSLIMQVEKALDLIYTKYMKALISYDGIYRNETFFFPKAAFRELLLNAVIHRDYLKPTPIQIKVYDHKIRIWNYGKMPADGPVEKLYAPHSSKPRNPGIANVFFKAGYVESWGRGYKNITDICKERRKELGEVLQLSDRSIRSQIHSLKEAGLIERVGSDRSGYWKILDGEN